MGRRRRRQRENDDICRRRRNDERRRGRTGTRSLDVRDGGAHEPRDHAPPPRLHVEWSRGKVFKKGSVSRHLGDAPPRLWSRFGVFVSTCNIRKFPLFNIRCYTCKFDTVYEKFLSNVSKCSLDLLQILEN